MYDNTLSKIKYLYNMCVYPLNRNRSTNSAKSEIDSFVCIILSVVAFCCEPVFISTT